MRSSLPRKFDGIYRSSVTLVAKTWQDSRWRKPILIFTILMTLFGSSAFLYDNPDKASALVQPNGRLYYGDATNTGVLKFQTNSFDFTYNGEVSSAISTTSSHIAHTVAKTAPSRDEVMIGHLKVDGRLDVIKGINGYDVAGDYAAAWNNPGTTGTQTCNSATQADCTRPFDIAYERLSGRAMVVYADTTNQKLYYCTWDGTAWSVTSPATCSPVNGTNDIGLTANGRPTFVSLKAQGGTNKILLGVSIDVAGTHEVESYIWDGSSWGTSLNATATTNATALALESGQAFDVEWESDSGEAMVLFGSSAGSGATKYFLTSGGTWGSEQAGPTSAGSNGTIMTLQMEADPASNRILYTYTDDGNDSAPGVWKADGSTVGWTLGNEETALESNDTGLQYTDIAWENTGSKAIWVAQDSTTSVKIEYQTVACDGTGCTFGSLTDVADAGLDDGTFIRSAASSNSGDIMIMWGDIDRNLYAQHWNGTAWEGAATAELAGSDLSPGTAESTQNHGVPATFAYVPYQSWQRNWQFFDDETVNDPSTGLNGAAENAVPTSVDAEEIIRLRINVNNPQAQGQTDARKKLQYASGASCTPNTVEGDPDCTWTDVGDTSETTAAWRYASRTADGAAVCADASHCDDNQTFTTARLTGTTQNGTYITDKDAAGGTNMDHNANAIVELDFPLKAEAVSGSTTYYFRAYDVDQARPVRREQDNDGANDCATAACTYPSLTTSAIPFTGTVFMADGTTPATTGNGGPCDGSTTVVAIRSNGGTADTGSCSNTDGTFSINQSNVTLSAGAELSVYLTSTMKANSVFLSDGGTYSGLNLYQNNVSLSHHSAGPVTILSMDSYDSDQNDTDILYDADDLATDIVTVESGNTLRIETGETFTPGGTVTTPKLRIKGTYTGGSETLTLNGTGSGTSRPLYIDGGTFTSSTNTTIFSGQGNLDIESTTYSTLRFFPTAGTITYTLNAGTLTAGSFSINQGANLTVDGDTNDPAINIRSISITSGTTMVPSTTATLTFSPVGTGFWTDTTASGQSIGNVSISGGSSTPTILANTNVKAHSVYVAASHTLDMNITDNLTLVGTSGTLFSIDGTFSEGTASVIFAADGSPTALMASTTESRTFNNLEFSPSLTADRTYDLGTSSVTVNGSMSTNPTASSTAKTLTVNLPSTNLPTTNTVTVDGSGTATGKITMGTSATLVTGYMIINPGGEFDNGTISGNLSLAATTGIPLTLNSGGKFTGNGGSTIFTMDANVTLTNGLFTGSNAFNDLSLSATLNGNRTFTLSNGDIEVVGTMSFVHLPAAAQSAIVNAGGNITAGLLTIGRFTNPAATTLDLRPTTTDYNLTAGAIEIKSNCTLDAGGSASIITLNSTVNGDVLITNTGSFLEGSSEVRVTSPSGYHSLLSAAETFHKLTINAAATVVNAGAAITTNNTAGNKLYIQNGVFNTENLTITPGTAGTLEIGATGTLCLGGTTGANSATCDDGATQTTAQNLPAFSTYTFDATSTVRYLADAAQTVDTTPTYGNLYLGPTLTAGRTYTFEAGTVNVNGDFTVDPDAASALALSVNAAGNIVVGATKTTTFTRTGSNATSLLDLRPVAIDYNLTSGFLNIAAGGTLNAASAASIITLTGTSGTLFSVTGTFIEGNSTVDFKSNASVTLNGNTAEASTFHKLTATPDISDNRVYTFGTNTLSVTSSSGSNDFAVNPTATVGGKTLTVNLSATTIISGETTLQGLGVNNPVAKLDTNSNTVNLGMLNIAANGNFTAGSSTVTLSFLSTPLVLDTSGDLVAGTSTFVFTGGNATISPITGTFTSPDNFYSLRFSPVINGPSVYELGTGALEINGDFNIVPTAGAPGASLTVNMGAAITVATGKTLTIDPGDTDSPTAILDLSPSTTDFSLTTGNLTIAANGTLTANGGSSAINISGNYTNSGTFTAASSTTTFADSSGTKTLSGTMTGSSAFNNIIYNGTGDTWNVNAAMTANGNYTMTAGTVVQGANIDITLYGDVLLSSGTVFTKASGTGKFIMDGDATTETFTDSTSPKQDLGHVQIGLSPGTTNLSSDLSATNMTIPTGDRLNTRGYEVTLTGFFDAQGTAHLDTTDTATGAHEGDGTIISVAGAWTFSGTGTFTLDTDAGTPTKNLFNGAADQTITTGGKTFYQVELNNTGAGGSDDLIISGALDVNGAFTITDGDLDTNTNDINTNVAHDFTIGTNGSIDAGTGTWTFDPTGTKTWTDNSSAKWSPGLVTIGSGASTPQINLGSSVEVTTITIAATHTLALQSSGYVLDIIGTGAASTVLTVSGTLTPGTNSTVKYSATNSGGTVTVTATTYKHLQLSGAETYDLGNNLTSTNAIAGNLTIDSGATLDAVSGSNYNIELAGNYANSGTFTARSGTVTLNGSATQTLSGTMTTTSAFNNLIISNSSGTSASDNERTGFVASVDFDAGATISGTYTITTANVRVEYNSGSTYTVTNINWNGGAVGTRIYFRNSVAGSGTWLLNVSGTQTDVSYVNVSRSDASSGNTIIATNGTNFDANNNTNWSFTATITVSGTCDQFDQTTDCTDDGANQFRVAFNGSLQAQVDTTVDGIWAITGVTAPSTGDIVTVFIDGEATDDEEAVAVTKYDGTGDITGLILYWRHLTIGSADNQTLANADIDAYDNSVSADEDIFFEVSAGDDLTVDTPTSYTDEELYIVSGNTYRPASAGGGDVNSTHLENDGVITADSNAFFITGSWQNDGTFTSGTSTVTFNSTSTGRTLAGTMTGATGKFYNLIFNGAAGAWSYSAAVETSNDFQVSNGAVTASNNNLTVGRDFTLDNTAGVSYTPGSSTIAIARHFNDVNGARFAEDTSTVQMTGTGTITYGNGGDFNNLSIGYSTFTTTFSANNWDMFGTLTLNGGSVVGGGSYVGLRRTTSGSSVVFASATTLSGTLTLYHIGAAGSITYTITGGNYGSWGVVPYSGFNSVTYTLGGNFTSTGFLRLEADNSLTGNAFNTGTNYSITTSYIHIAPCAPTRTGSWAIDFNDSTITLSSTTNALYVGTDCGTHTLDLDTSDTTVNGSVAFIGGTTGTVAITPGTSDFTFAPSASQTETYASNGQSLWNMTINGANSAATIQPTSAVDVNNNFTITAGTYDTVSGSNWGLNIGNNYSNSATFTARSGTVTFDATDTGNTLGGTMTGGSAFYNLVFNGVSGGWTYNAAVAATNDFTVTNGAVTANGNNLTVTRDFTLANTTGVSYVAGSTTITVSRHYNDTGGKLSADTSTLALNGTGTMDIVNAFAFYNLNVAYSGFTTTFDTSIQTRVSNDATLNGGTLTGSSSAFEFLTTANNQPLTFNSATTMNGSGFNYLTFGINTGSVTSTIGAGDYGSWTIFASYSANNGIHQLGGNITTTGQLRVFTGGPTGGAFNTQNFNINADSIQLGSGGATTSFSTSFGSSTITLAASGDALYPESSGGTYPLDLGSSSINTVGNVRFANGSGSITVTPGTSTVTWTHTSGIKTYAPNGQSLNNLIINGTGGTLQPNAAVDVNNNFTITAGTYDTVSGSNYALTIGGNYSNSGTFTAQEGTVTFDATDTGNTLGGTMTGSSAFYSLTFNGSGGEWTPGAAVTALNDLTMTAGSLLGTQNVSVTGHVQGTNGVINLTGGTFTHRLTLSGNKNFGTTSGSAAWTFSGLTFANDSAICTGRNSTTQTGGTGGITVTGILNIGESGDTAGCTTALDAGNRIWTLSGTGGDPFQILASPVGNLTPSTSTFAFTGNNGAGATTIQEETYNNLTINNGSETYNLEANTSAAATTITAGTLALNGFTFTSSGDLTVDGTLSGNTNVIANAEVTGSGTINLTGGTFTQRIVSNNSYGFGSSSGTNNWTFNNLVIRNSDTVDHTVTTRATGSGQIIVTGTLTVGSGTDSNNLTLNNNTNDRIIDVDGSVDITIRGVLQASNSASFTVGDNWTNNGTFTHGSGTVTFDTTTAATFTGATTFYNFTSTTAAKTLEFTSGQTFTIDTGGLLTLTGAADPNEIQIKSTTPTSQWLINHQGAESVDYVQVIDSGCDGASTQITTTNSVNDGNNGTCWLFGSTFEQADYRFGEEPEDSSTNSEYAGMPAENTAYSTSGTGDIFRLRMLLHVGGSNLAINGETFKLQFGEKTAATCTSGVSWGDVSPSSGVIRYSDGAPADGDNITTVTGDPDHSGHTRQYQDYEESNNFTNSVSGINSGQDGVWAFSLVNNSAVAGKRYCFKAVKSTGTDLDTYTFYPEVVIDEELVFTLDSTSKTFGVVTPGANPTDVSSTLTTTTNSSTGYVVYAWSSQVMTMDSFSIDDWTGTNATPTTFGNGSFGFGYTTNDSSLTGGTADRFTNGGAKYAGFTHVGPGQPVADRTSGPVTGSSDTITYRLAASGAQAAGTYSTVIVYVCSVTF